MTIGEAIALVDDLKPNVISREIKVVWLSVLDALVYRNLMMSYEECPAAMPSYTADTPEDSVLLIPHPYDTLYRRWLEAQIDLTNGEFERYNAVITVFNDEYRVFENDYHRTHRIPGRRRFQF